MKANMGVSQSDTGESNIVVGETYYNNHGEPIRFGEFIKLHFAGGPADAPEPWKLVKAANGTSSVNPKANWVTLTIEDANGEEHDFKPANIYSPVRGSEAVDYDRVARQVASGAAGGNPLDTYRELARAVHDLGPDAPSSRPVRREPREKGRGRGRWLALDTMDHIIGSLQRSQQRMSAGGVQDGAYLVRVAFEELKSLHESLVGGVLTDDAWDV